MKHLWYTDRRKEALQRLIRLCDVVDLTSHCESYGDNALRASCWLELGEWQIEENVVPNASIPETLQIEVLSEFKRAKLMDGGYKAWHNWALLNFRIAQQVNDGAETNAHNHKVLPISSLQRKHVMIAIKAFVNAICLVTKRWSASVQQYILNFLT